MNARDALVVFFLFCCFQLTSLGSSSDLATLKKDQAIGDLRIAHLYADSGQQVVGAKLEHAPTGAPIYVFQIETVPQVFMWVDTPADSNRGLAHSLEHLLAGKGTKGRYVHLLTEMKMSRSAAATTDDYNFYAFSSGTGLAGFFEQFHAWLDALYTPDFTDLEAEREFYHVGISSDPKTRKETLVEKGSVYDEMQTGQGYAYYFELNRLVFGDHNPFAYNISGMPDEMRQVTPNEIRRFYAKQYHLGPTTGFIFVLDPKENVFDFLQRISRDLGQFSNVGPNRGIQITNEEPKYPNNSSPSTEPRICPFPSSSETDPGEVRFGWKPVKVDSQADVRLLQLFLRILGDGEQSVLYKSLVDSKTREMDSGAGSVESLVFLENSPHFPAEFIGLSGIPGNRLDVPQITRIRNLILTKIAEISSYPNNSAALASFNRSAMLEARAWRRSQRIWVKNTPRFGGNYDTDWKEYLEYLDMDSSFVRSLSDEAVWNKLDKRLQSGRNIWRDLITQFHLLDVPYATASAPSPRLLEEMETARQDRLRAKAKELMERFGTRDEQKALTEVGQEEAAKTREIDKIAARVVQPKFTEHPPLTPDDDVRYRQFRLEAVPVIATFFDRAPTIDVGLSFDLKEIPQKYYKYLPILPKCIDSLGLKTRSQTVAYPDLLGKIRTETSGLSVDYAFNPVSHRADLSIRLSATNPTELRSGLAIVRNMIDFNYLELSNVDRLRDLVDKRLWEEGAYNKGSDYYWFLNPAYAFRYQNDPLYLALRSVFTRAHWDARLKWRLHKPVAPAEIERLDGFAKNILATAFGLSRKELSQRLNGSDAKGLEGELVEFWEKNLSSFSESELVEGLRHLTSEVEEDLRVGRDQTIAEIRDLQRLVMDRRALNIDLTVDASMDKEVQAVLGAFVKTLPTNDDQQQASPPAISMSAPVIRTLEKRYKLSGSDDFPWYVGFEDSQASTASMFFVADHPGYTDLDRKSLLEVLSSKMVAGSGPHTPYMKVEEDGLAYGAGITSDPSRRTIWYYAERSPDVAALLELVNSIATALPQNRDPALIDYALQKAFPLPRSMATFSERGRGIATDIRDGDEAQKIRRFSEAILKLREDPKLLSELDHTLLDSIGAVLVNDEFKQQQRQKRSLFFFVGPDRLLSDAETRLHIRLYRVYASDFWLDF